MSVQTRLRLSEWGILLLLAFTILWKGGKSLESTWLIAGAGAVLILLYWFEKYGRMSAKERPLEARQDMAFQKTELPLYYWCIALLYLGFSIVSYVFSETRNYGLDEVLRSAGYTLLFLWVARKQIDDVQSAFSQRFPLVVTLATTVAGIIGVAVYALQPVNRFVGTFFDYRFHTDYWPNAWAEMVLLAWPLIVLCAWRHSSSLYRKSMPVILGFVIGTLFLSYSRGAMLAFIAQIFLIAVLFGMMMSRDIRYQRTWKPVTLSIAIRALATLIMAFATFFAVNALREVRFDVQSVSEKVTFTAAEGKSSVNERAQFWEQALNFIQEKPLLGWGPYSFRFVQPQKMTTVLATSDHPHNVALKIAMERGIISLALFASIFGVVLGLALFSFFNLRRGASMENDVQVVTMIVAVTGVLLHNMIDFNLQFVSLGMGTIMCLGFLVIPSKTNSSDATLTFRRWRLRKNLSKIDCILSGLILVVLLWEGAFLVTSSLGRHALAAGDAETALLWFRRSHGEMFSRDLYLSEAQLEIDRKQYAAAESSLKQYESVNPHDPRLWKMYGDLYLQTSETEKALAALEKAYERGKYTDAGIMHLLLEAIRRSGNENLYAASKLEFDALFSAYADSVERNEHFIALSQNVEELQEIAQLLGLLYPIDNQRYKAIARKAMQHARTEREVYSARSQGLLW